MLEVTVTGPTLAFVAAARICLTGAEFGATLDGATLDRTSFHRVDLSEIDLTDVAVRAYGNFALVTHKISFHFVKDGAPGVANLSGIDVWVNKGHSWQLLARQLTRLP